MATDVAKPIVLITGAAGNIGTSLAERLADAYRVVGIDTDSDRVAAISSKEHPCRR